MAQKKRNQGKGIKYDNLKPLLALIVPEAEIEEGKAMSLGAEKYGAYNFTNGLTVIRLMSACKRHINAFLAGEDFDPDSKHWHCHHLGNARACLGMALHILHHMPELDDRFKPVKKIVKTRVVKKKRKK